MHHFESSGLCRLKVEMLACAFKHHSTGVSQSNKCRNRKRKSQLIRYPSMLPDNPNTLVLQLHLTTDLFTCQCAILSVK